MSAVRFVPLSPALGVGRVGQGSARLDGTNGTRGTTGTAEESGPRVLIPYDKREALTLQQAAGIAGRTSETIRRWCENESLGRRVGGRWAVSHPALLMWLDGDSTSLRMYLSGDRQSNNVRAYFRRARL